MVGVMGLILWVGRGTEQQILAQLIPATVVVSSDSIMLSANFVFEAYVQFNF